MRDVLTMFREELVRVSRLMRADPTRDMPEEVRVEPIPINLGYRCGVKEEEDVLIISSLLGPKIGKVVRREAFRLLIPTSFLEEVEEVNDLAWAYSGAEERWWRACSRRAVIPGLPKYDAPRLLGALSREDLLHTLRSVLHTVRMMETAGVEPSLEAYYRALLIFISGRPPSLTKSEKRVMRVLFRRPSARLVEVARAASSSPSTASRAVKKLVEGDVIMGPLQVNLSALGLDVVVCEVRDRSLLRRLASLPLTYSIIEPVSSLAPAFAVLMVPREGLSRAASTLRGLGLSVSRVVRRGVFVRLDPRGKDEIADRLSLGYLSARDSERPSISVERCRLTRDDLRILSEIYERGRISKTTAESIGPSRIRRRLKNLRNRGLVFRSYSPSGRGLGEPFVIQVEADEKEYMRILTAVAAVSSTFLMYLSGDFTGVWGLAYFMSGGVLCSRILSLVFGERLRLMEPIMTAYSSQWGIPWEFWDEEGQRFDVERFISSLSAL